MSARLLGTALTALLVATNPPFLARSLAAETWRVGTPIVTYWAGPPMSENVASQMEEGGFNLVWCDERDLDLVHIHGLRAQLQDSLLTPASLGDPAEREKLDALIKRVRKHPALYAYFITDEPGADQFPALGKLVAYLRERDPAHLPYINLFPTYASNKQLGNKGAKIPSYQEHLRQYIRIVKPSLVSYDHYQFSVKGDSPDYFLNLALVREAAQNAGLPFLNIVQACTWTPSMRVPTSNEVCYLVYTTLAYGAQGISYYVYCYPGHTGGIANADGTPTALYHALKTYNRQFVAIARELQPLKSLAVYHAGMLPPGAKPLPRDAAFSIDPPLARMNFNPPNPAKGIVLGYFGRAPKAGKTAVPTHAVVVNMDYKSDATVGIVGRKRLEIFDATLGKWSKADGKRTELHLPPGGGQLIRVR